MYTLLHVQTHATWIFTSHFLLFFIIGQTKWRPVCLTNCWYCFQYMHIYIWYTVKYQKLPVHANPLCVCVCVTTTELCALVDYLQGCAHSDIIHQLTFCFTHAKQKVSWCIISASGQPVSQKSSQCGFCFDTMNTVKCQTWQAPGNFYSIELYPSIPLSVNLTFLQGCHGVGGRGAF